MLSIYPDIDGFDQPVDHGFGFRTARTPHGIGGEQIHARLQIDHRPFRGCWSEMLPGLAEVGNEALDSESGPDAQSQ